MRPDEVWPSIYRIGKLYDDYDSCVYVIDAQSELVLVDAGTCGSFNELVNDLEELGLEAKKVGTIIATHCHFDHIGSLAEFKEKFGTIVFAHKLDARAIETGEGTHAERFGLDYKPCKVDVNLEGGETLKFGQYELKIVHTPGHTPGHIACYLDLADGEQKRILFGGDVNGPYRTPGEPRAQAIDSLQRLMALKADILCEGHFGVFQPASEAQRCIKFYLDLLL
ncbi:MAG: Zn-dependent hydrolase including glyoxylase [Dehalococcoidales bacterium]|nr:Zn-dependent hydrolase including glyoxylase [Dehalococcoidales bacterium]